MIVFHSECSEESMGDPLGNDQTSNDGIGLFLVQFKDPSFLGMTTKSFMMAFNKN